MIISQFEVLVRLISKELEIPFVLGIQLLDFHQSQVIKVLVHNVEIPTSGPVGPSNVRSINPNAFQWTLDLVLEMFEFDDIVVFGCTWRTQATHRHPVLVESVKLVLISKLHNLNLSPGDRSLEQVGYEL